LQRRSLENRKEKQENFNEWVAQLKKHSKSDLPRKFRHSLFHFPFFDFSVFVDFVVPTLPPLSPSAPFLALSFPSGSQSSMLLVGYSLLPSFHGHHLHCFQAQPIFTMQTSASHTDTSSTVWTAWDKESLAHKEAGAARLIEERRIAEQVAQARKDEIKNSAA
jgi:hypothetical protein